MQHKITPVLDPSINVHQFDFSCPGDNSRDEWHVGSAVRTMGGAHSQIPNSPRPETTQHLKVVQALLLFLTVLTIAFTPVQASAAERPSLHGVVTDSHGSAIQGARVDISTAGPKVGTSLFCPSCYRDCSKWTTTDDQGKFNIKDVDPTLKFRLVIAMPGHRTLQTKPLDPDKSPFPLKLADLPDDIDPAHVVTGVVTLQGVPVAGALIEPCGAKTPDRTWGGRVDGVEPSVTDDKGQFQMILPKDFLAIDLEVTGDGFCGEKQNQLQPGKGPVKIEVHTGATVVGKLVHQGQPVPEMSIAVVQFDRGRLERIFIAAVGEVTDQEGRFEFRYLPPSERYCIFSLVGDARSTDSPYILTTKTFKVPASGETRDLGQLEVSSPVAIRGKVSRVDDQPIPENLSITLGRDPAWDLISIPVNKDGSFEATGLPPETYEIRVGDRHLVIIAEQVSYQMLSESSFGIRVTDSIDDLVIPVRGKE